MPDRDSPAARTAPRIGLYHPYPHRMGGSQLVTLLLAEHLGPCGYVPVIVCPQDGAFVAAARARGIETLICEPGPAWQLYGKGADGPGRWLSFAHLRQLLQYWRRLGEFSRRHALDLLHCHDARAVVMAAPAARLAGIPSLWHLHSPPAQGRKRWLDALLSACVAHRVFVSAAMLAAWNLPRWMLGKHEVIPNGIVCGDPAPAVRGSNAPLIVAAGTLHPRKGFDVLIRALPLLASQTPRFAVWIAGHDAADGSQERYLRQLVVELELEDRVQFLGQRDDIAQLLATATLVVVPSMSEPFGMVALEAMIQGKPVIASRTGGLPDIVAHEQTGLLVQPGNTQELAAALARIIDDPALAAAMGRAGLARAREHFSAARMARRFAALYAQMLKVPDMSCGPDRAASSRRDQAHKSYPAPIGHRSDP